VTAEVEVGQKYSFSRTFTDGDVSLYCGLTGDYNPFHLDETFASASRVGARIVPGLLTGSLMTHVGGMLGVLGTEMRFSFLAPVFIGDTITCTVTIASVDERGIIDASVEMVNQNAERVLDASFVGKPMSVRLAPTGHAE
jgi:3-hydroxybutyryl-CoA dehydratase